MNSGKIDYLRVGIMLKSNTNRNKFILFIKNIFTKFPSHIMNLIERYFLIDSQEIRA